MFAITLKRFLLVVGTVTLAKSGSVLLVAHLQGRYSTLLDAAMFGVSIILLIVYAKLSYKARHKK